MRKTNISRLQILLIVLIIMPFSYAMSVEINLSTDANLRFSGSDVSDYSGTSVASGDINDDGIEDIIIGAYGADSNEQSYSGETYIYFGGIQGQFNISDGADIIVNGIDTSDYSGHSVDSNDINGDGIDDIIIGAYGADPDNQAVAGETYVIFGGAISGVINLSTNADIIINGIKTFDRSGYAISSGDINGDNKGDIIIGAYESDPNGVGSAGETYVVFGGVTGIINLSTDADIRIKGIDASDYSAFSVASGDINGDNKDDVIIGAYQANPNGISDAGETYVVFGGATGIINLSTDADITINGIKSGDWSGWAVSSGDINGDNKDDIIIGAHKSDPNGSASGEAYVVFGGVTGIINLSTDVNITVRGITTNDQVGFSVSSGDIDNDNYDDLVIGAYSVDSNMITNAGATYILYGKGLIGTVNVLTDANITIKGISNGDQSGWDVATGYIDDDDNADIIIGAKWADTNGKEDTGETYVVMMLDNETTYCSDGIDNDHDGYRDCDDIDCSNSQSCTFNISGVESLGNFGLFDSDNNELFSGNSGYLQSLTIKTSSEVPIVDFESERGVILDFSDVSIGSKPGKSFIHNLGNVSGVSDITLYALFSSTTPSDEVFICTGMSDLSISHRTCEKEGGTLYEWNTETEDGVKKGGVTFRLDQNNQRYIFENITGTGGGESSEPYTTSTLTCNIINWTDIDPGNDKINTENSIYSWYINDENESTYQLVAGQNDINLTPENFDSNDCLICQVAAIDVHGFGNLTLNSSEVCIQNKPPSQPDNFKVRDGITSWDNASRDTHDKNADLNWSSYDADGDTILTYVCVANSTDNRNISNCLYYFQTQSGTFNVSNIAGLDYSGVSITYYVRLTPSDSEDNGTYLDTTFDLINSIPNTPVSLDTTETHDNTPTLAWTATDADDGTDNHWPADTLTYHIVIEDTVNSTIYSSSNSADKTGYISDSLPWGTPNGAYANRTLTATIYTTDGNTDGLSANYTPDFVLYDFLPTVTDVSLTDSGSYSSCTGSTCALTPVSGTNTSLAVKLVATDLDGDCDLTSSAHFYLCLNTTYCNSDIGNYSWEVDSIDMVGSNCTYTFTANKTSSDSTPEFWRLANTYKFYSLISGQGGARISDTNAEGDWIYNTLSSINYSTIVYLGDGTLTLGQWNNGTSKAIVTNFGNNILDLQWRSTDPTSGSDTWNLNGSDLYIDDDLNVHDDSDSVLRTVMNGSDDYFNPASGLQLCLENTCNVSLRNETMDTYYHAYPPIGLTAGTYNSTITITLGTH